MRADWVMVEVHSLVHGRLSSGCVLAWHKWVKDRLQYLVRALIPVTRALPSRPNHFPKAAPPNTITLGVRISTGMCGDGTRRPRKGPNLQRAEAETRLEQFLSHAHHVYTA